MPDRQLSEVAAWLRDVELHQQHMQASQAAAAAATSQHGAADLADCTWPPLDAADQPKLPPLAPPTMLSPSSLLGRHRSPAMVAGGLRTLFSVPDFMAPPPPQPSGQAQEEAEHDLHAGASASATALAVYQDTAFYGGGIVVPVNLTVTVTVALGARGGEDQTPALTAEACRRAKQLAESQTRLAVDHSGRQLVECQLAEMVVQRARQQRHKARQQRQEARKVEARRVAAQQSVQLLRAIRARVTEASGSGSRPGAASATPGGAAVVSSTYGPSTAVTPEPELVSSSTSAPTDSSPPARAHSCSSLGAEGAGVVAAAQSSPISDPAPGRNGHQVHIDNLASVLEGTALDTSGCPNGRIGLADLADVLHQD